MIMINIPIGFYGFKLEGLEDIKKVEKKGELIGVKIFEDVKNVLYVGKPIYGSKELGEIMDKKEFYGSDLTNKLKEIGVSIKRHECSVLIRSSAMEILENII